MQSVFKKGQAFESVYAQMLIIIIAFLIMGISSFSFTRNLERSHLRRHAENALYLAELEINSYFERMSGGEDEIRFSEYARELNNILEQIVPGMLTESSYGILLDNDLGILAHPETSFFGQKIYFIFSDIASLSHELLMGRNIDERRVRNYMRKTSIVYFRKIHFDLYLGIVIPENQYFRSITNMAAFLIILGLLLAWGLCTMLYFISQSKKKSDNRTKQKSNFLATISHEIRTPLNAILGMTEIQMQNASHSPDVNEAFVKINNSGNLLLNIINDVLDLSKIESGKLELLPLKYAVAGMLNDIIQLNYIRYEGKPIEFKISINENVPSILVGDELRIKQIFNNLLSNAFKYTDRGTVEFSVDAECVGRGGGGVIVTLIFTVKDTGQGMTPDQINKLFDEYSRFNLEANRTTEGAGLGMAITQNLIQLMYGKINVKSEFGEGTAVTVRLPQKTDGIGISGVIGREVAENLRQFKYGKAAQLKKILTTYEYMPYGKVLIVDDVETNLFVAKGLMVPYGLNIDLADSGFDAIDKVKSGSVYDIIFMDHMMPKMDGIEATKKLRQMGYNHPVVALTANALAGHAEMFLSNSFDDFISKPIDIRRLNELLNRLIRDKQPIEVIQAALNEKNKNEKPLMADISQLAEIFARDAKKAVKNLDDCIKNGFQNEDSIQMYIVNIHAIKSALANIGETELSAAASSLEQACREKDINLLLSKTGKFLDKLNMVVGEIKLTKAETDIIDSEETLLFLNEKLGIIREACAAFDKKTAKNALNELRTKEWSQNKIEFIDSIAEHLLHSEFDGIITLVENYSKGE